MNKNRKKNSPIPLLGLQMAIFNTYPTKAHKRALANMRADLAESVYYASEKHVGDVNPRWYKERRT